MALAGVLTALRAQGKPAKEITNQRILCVGGGSAGLGVVNSLIDGMVEEGLTREVNSFFGSLTKHSNSPYGTGSEQECLGSRC